MYSALQVMSQHIMWHNCLTSAILTQHLLAFPVDFNLGYANQR
jgi:hypothetical protein